jgi:hypothetical protein
MSINIAIVLILVAYGNVHLAFAAKAHPQEGQVKYAQYCIPDNDNSDRATIFCRA